MKRPEGGIGTPLVSDELWSVIKPLLPPEPPKPKGGRPRVSNRAALTGGENERWEEAQEDEIGCEPNRREAGHEAEGPATEDEENRVRDADASGHDAEGHGGSGAPELSLSQRGGVCGGDRWQRAYPGPIAGWNEEDGP